jgi:general secretion pathway protein M
MDQLKAQFQTWYAGLQPRERLLVACAAGLVVIAILYLLFFGPFAKALNTRQQNVERKQQDLVWMRGMSNTVRMSASGRTGGGESLVVLVNRTAQQAGITGALMNQAPQGDSGIRVRLEGVQFDALVAWLGMLHEQSGIEVDNASIERAERTGIVNASLTLQRSARP